MLRREHQQQPAAGTVLDACHSPQIRSGLGSATIAPTTATATWYFTIRRRGGAHDPVLDVGRAAAVRARRLLGRAQLAREAARWRWCGCRGGRLGGRPGA